MSRSIWPKTLRVNVNLGVMTIKGYFSFPKAPRHEPHHQMKFRIRTCCWGRVLPLCRDAIGVFYRPWTWIMYTTKYGVMQQFIQVRNLFVDVNEIKRTNSINISGSLLSLSSKLMNIPQPRSPSQSKLYIPRVSSVEKRKKKQTQN